MIDYEISKELRFFLKEQLEKHDICYNDKRLGFLNLVLSNNSKFLEELSNWVNTHSYRYNYTHIMTPHGKVIIAPFFLKKHTNYTEVALTYNLQKSWRNWFVIINNRKKVFKNWHLK